MNGDYDEYENGGGPPPRFPPGQRPPTILRDRADQDQAQTADSSTKAFGLSGVLDREARLHEDHLDHVPRSAHRADPAQADSVPGPVDRQDHAGLHRAAWRDHHTDRTAADHHQCSREAAAAIRLINSKHHHSNSIRRKEALRRSSSHNNSR
ncbi:hypothetical protein AAVH_40930 [Aphelenchoides avenae]|nr:hypothetical protein AAVH_40930 [Aphelenchus avenae]